MAEMSDEEEERLFWKLLNDSGVPYSIDMEERLHFDLETLDAMDRALPEDDETEYNDTTET